MRLRKFFLYLGLGLFSSLGACGHPPAAESTSNLAIRQGNKVAQDAAGPERRSTIGLVGALKDGQFGCTAAPLSSRLLVTAAHCLLDGAKIFAYTAIEATDIRSAEDVIPVDRAIVHPEFVAGPDEEIRPNDIAVVALRSALPDGFIVPPLVSADFTVTPGEQVLLAGYGISEAGDDSGTLRSVLSTLRGYDEEGRLLVDDARRRGACSGDSGGPLFAKRNNQWQLAGVLSGGPVPCRGENSYTNVATNLNFIASAKNKLESQMTQ